MQLSAVLAQPPVAAGPGASPFLSILTTLRGTRPAADAAAPEVAPTVAAGPGPLSGLREMLVRKEPATVAPTAQSAAAEVSEPSMGQKLLSGVATSQNKYLANQQMLAVITAGLGARFSAIAKGVWAHLRGTEQAAPQQQDVQATS